ncbi:MAG: hypothetical protein QOF60_1511 [Actinomycetota bacterium]|nr:hypothetical protein [Actinomycetota bacterium]
MIIPRGRRRRKWKLEITVVNVKIEYRTDPGGLRVDQVDGFFVGWQTRPSAATLLAHLDACYRCSIAVDTGGDRVVGFATAISDGVLFAFLPLLEVLPGWHGRGIGAELLTRLTEQLGGLYIVRRTGVAGPGST